MVFRRRKARRNIFSGLSELSGASVAALAGAVAAPVACAGGYKAWKHWRTRTAPEDSTCGPMHECSADTLC
jgi:hypothetical protein